MSVVVGVDDGVVENVVDGLTEDVDGLKEDVDGLTEGVDGLTEDVDGVDTEDNTKVVAGGNDDAVEGGDDDDNIINGDELEGNGENDGVNEDLIFFVRTFVFELFGVDDFNTLWVLLELKALVTSLDLFDLLKLLFTLPEFLFTLSDLLKLLFAVLEL